MQEAKQIIGLREMQVGQKGRIVSVNIDGDLGRRMRDMGLIPGTDIEVIGQAPLRDPVALRLLGITLALRNSEADYISVEV
ncbi:MAG: ferrous iron transport protein A [Desulfovibrio sp.]|nr:ferrous iron transport protein A [Desulfovibrio sp.]MBQ4568424.1 ferrous iron transport protein A [Desulfovibrio sp.]